MAALDAIRAAKIKRSASLCMESKCFRVTVVPYGRRTDWLSVHWPSGGGPPASPETA